MTALEKARRILEEHARKSNPMVSARVVQLPEDALDVARALIRMQEALERIRSQAHNLPRSATAQAIVDLVDAALSDESGQKS